MIDLIHGISLRTVRYSDSSSMLTLWSRELGRLSAVIPSGKGREAQRRRALMMPMGTFEAVARRRGTDDIVTLADVRPYGPSVAADGDPVRAAVAMLVAECLYTVLRESTPDTTLSDFLFQQTAVLSGASGAALANFPIVFLFRLGRFLGIAPDTGTYRPGAFFDMSQGTFTTSMPVNSSRILDAGAAAMVATLARINDRTLHLLRLNSGQRSQILDLILEYYTIHLTPMNSLPSLDIVRAILH